MGEQVTTIAARNGDAAAATWPRVRRLWPWAALLLLAFGLLLVSAAGRSLWIDEHYSVSSAQQNSLADVLSHVIETERRPPLSYVMLHLWRAAAGSSDMAYRFPSILWTLVLVLLTGRLARALGLPALLSSLLLAVSPFMLLFGVMVRPYSMTAALGVACALAFLSWRDGRRREGLLAYVVLGGLLIWTDYAGLGVLLALNLVALLTLARRQWGAWIVAQLSIVALYLPWMGIAARHATGNSPVAADLAGGPLGLALKLAYPVLSFSSGETIFPWDVRGSLGVLVVCALVFYGLWTLRSRRSVFVFGVIYIVVPVLFIVFLFTFLIAQGTFVLIPSRAMAAYPVLMIVLAAGLAALPRRIALAAALLVAIAWATAAANLLAGTHYHNPIYAIRVREMAAQVARDAQPGDLVLSDQDSLFFHYYPADATAPNVSTEATDAQVRLAGATRVWLLVLGRDRTRVGAPAKAILDALQRNGFQEQQQWGSGPEDPIYKQVKEKLLGRPDYEYKALLRLYVRSGRPQGR